MSERRYQLWLRLIFHSEGHIVAAGRVTCTYILLDTHNTEQCKRLAEELPVYGYWLQSEGPTPNVQALISCRNGVLKSAETSKSGMEGQR